MSWQEISELFKDENVTIGAHTVTNQTLNTIPPKQIATEITQSLAIIIESHVKKPILHFCYPGGEVSNEVFSVMKRYQIRTATTRPSNIIYNHRSILEQLLRLMVTNEDMTNFKLKRSGMAACVANRLKRIIKTPITPPIGNRDGL